MADQGIDCHMQTRLPITEHTFKWTVEKFCLLPEDCAIDCPLFSVVVKDEWNFMLRKTGKGDFSVVLCYKRGSDVIVECTVTLFDNKKISIYNKTARSEFSVRGNRTANLINLPFFPFNSDDLLIVCLMKVYQQELWMKIYNFPRPMDEMDNLRKLAGDLKKMYEDSVYTDIIIRVGGDSVQAHRMMLCDQSVFFNEKIKTASLVDGKYIIDVEGISINVLKKVVQFLYTKVMDDNSIDELLPLFHAAKVTEVTELQNRCRDILVSRLDMDCAIELLMFSHRYNDKVLKVKVITFIVSSDLFSDLLITQDWSVLVDNEPMLANEVLHLYTNSVI